jgi:hypothetical protein
MIRIHPRNRIATLLSTNIRRSGAARESGKCLVHQVQRKTLRRACDRRARLRPPARPGRVARTCASAG